MRATPRQQGNQGEKDRWSPEWIQYGSDFYKTQVACVKSREYTSCGQLSSVGVWTNRIGEDCIFCDFDFDDVT